MTTTEPTTEVTSQDPTLPPAGLSRRWALRAGGVGLVGAIVAACSGDDDDSTMDQTTDPTSTEDDDDANNDLAIAAVAASLEVLAVSTYDKALQAASSGALGEVPDAVAEFVTVARAQHQEHLDRWNEVLTAGGQAAVDTPPSDLAADIDAELADVKDVEGAARLALTLEETAAATYLDVLNDLTPASRGVAGSIICIDRQHAAILHFVLGEYPVPDTFASTDAAYQPA